MFQMKLLSRLASVAVVASGAIVFQVASPVEAAIFDFTTLPIGNQIVKTVIDSGVTLLVSDSDSTGNNSGTLETSLGSTGGLCAYAVAAGNPRCGYGPTGAVSSFQLKFDKAVSISSFVVSTFNNNLMDDGTLSLSLDGINFSPTTFSSTGNVSLATAFSAAANQPIFVQTAASIASGNSSGTALIRLSSLTAQERVPAPLPLLGAAAGFRFSRKIRQRISASALKG